MSFLNPQMTMIMDEEIRRQLKEHEGYRQQIYLDSLGVPTGGYGHAFQKGSQLPSYIWDEIFNVDFQNAKDAVMDLIHQKGWYDIGYVRRNVLINMVFNLGIGGVLRFKEMIRAIDDGNYVKASEEMLMSVWASLVGERSMDLARQMRTGNL